MASPTSFNDSATTPSLDPSDLFDFSSLSPSPSPPSPFTIGSAQTYSPFSEPLALADMDDERSYDDLLGQLASSLIKPVTVAPECECRCAFENISLIAVDLSPFDSPASAVSNILLPEVSQADGCPMSLAVTVDPGLLQVTLQGFDGWIAPAPATLRAESILTYSHNGPVTKPVAGRKRSRAVDTPCQKLSDVEKLRLLPSLVETEDEGKKGQARALFPQTEITAIQTHLGISESKLKSLGSWGALYSHLHSTAKEHLIRLYDIVAALQERRAEGRASKKAKDAKLKSDAAARASAEARALEAEARASALQTEVEQLRATLVTLASMIWQQDADGSTTGDRLSLLSSSTGATSLSSPISDAGVNAC